MLLLTIIVPLFLCLGTHAASNTREIVEGLPDSGYIYQKIDIGKRSLPNVIDLNGNPVPEPPFPTHAPTGPPVPGDNESPHRENKDTFCIDNEQIDETNWAVVRDILTNWCDAGNTLLPQHVYSWQFNGSAAFICNYGGRQTCLGQEYINDVGKVADYCGRLAAGWYYQSTSNRSHGRGLVGEGASRSLTARLRYAHVMT
ncbi:hypothetical protein PG993_014834 [Apiospora rasikravindrae]|uniref:Ecp2 effector protein domain-containing protein n=1 Tax=Apiospora rasikravindrae TaxID=990691 RepID=A0ABR1RNY3_9PEZI